MQALPLLRPEKGEGRVSGRIRRFGKRVTITVGEVT